MSKRGNETPRKSRRLNEEASSDDFHAPSFKILSQTQSQPSCVKVKSRSVKSTTEKKNIQRKIGRREKGKKRKKKMNLRKRRKKEE